MSQECTKQSRAIQEKSAQVHINTPGTMGRSKGRLLYTVTHPYTLDT